MAERTKRGNADCLIARLGIDFSQIFKKTNVVRCQCESACPEGRIGDNIRLHTRNEKYGGANRFTVIECDGYEGDVHNAQLNEVPEFDRNPL